MNYLLGTDIGTSGTKTILMDTEGKLVAQDLQEYDVLTPAPLWAEQWPDVWYEATKDSIRNTVAKAKEAGIKSEDIKVLRSADCTEVPGSRWMKIWSRFVPV